MGRLIEIERFFKKGSMQEELWLLKAKLEILKKSSRKLRKLLS